jgi:eukaryotic-like serine/threonine-protein kinase
VPRLEQEALAHAQAQGDRRLQAGVFTALARIALLAGDPGQAEARSREALALLDGTSPLRPTALSTLATALLARGRAEEALEEASEAMCLLAQPGRVEGETLVRLAYAEALRATSDHAGALAAVRDLCRRIQSRAEAIAAGAGRERFLARVPQNALAAALLAAWSARSTP